MFKRYDTSGTVFLSLGQYTFIPIFLERLEFMWVVRSLVIDAIMIPKPVCPISSLLRFDGTFQRSLYKFKIYAELCNYKNPQLRCN